MITSKRNPHRGKPAYTDYVNWIMRYYAASPDTAAAKNEIEQHNWQACNRVLSALPLDERQIMLAVFASPGDNMQQIVDNVAADLDVPINRAWQVVTQTTKQIAKERGLIP